MNDFKLVSQDLSVNGMGEFELVYNSDCVWQQLVIALALWEGDYFYDVSSGVPYRSFFKNLDDLLMIQGFFLSYFYRYNIIRVMNFVPTVKEGSLYLNGILTDVYGVTKVLTGMKIER
jgi:hypothetical protein